jgi:hypothetical protein
MGQNLRPFYRHERRARHERQNQELVVFKILINPDFFRLSPFLAGVAFVAVKQVWASVLDYLYS